MMSSRSTSMDLTVNSNTWPRNTPLKPSHGGVNETVSEQGSMRQSIQPLTILGTPPSHHEPPYHASQQTTHTPAAQPANVPEGTSIPFAAILGNKVETPRPVGYNQEHPLNAQNAQHRISNTSSGQNLNWTAEEEFVGYANPTSQSNLHEQQPNYGSTDYYGFQDIQSNQIRTGSPQVNVSYQQPHYSLESAIKFGHQGYINYADSRTATPFMGNTLYSYDDPYQSNLDTTKSAGTLFNTFQQSRVGTTVYTGGYQPHLGNVQQEVSQQNHGESPTALRQYIEPYQYNTDARLQMAPSLNSSSVQFQPYQPYQNVDGGLNLLANSFTSSQQQHLINRTSSPLADVPGQPNTHIGQYPQIYRGYGLPPVRLIHAPIMRVSQPGVLHQSSSPAVQALGRSSTGFTSYGPSISPQSHIGSDTMPSRYQSSGHTELSGSHSRQRACLDCIIEPQMTLWPCGCGVCARCSQKAQRHHDEKNRLCINCGQYVLNIIKAEPELKPARTVDQYSSTVPIEAPDVQKSQAAGSKGSSTRAPPAKIPGRHPNVATSINGIATLEEAWMYMPVSELGKAKDGTPYGRGMGGEGGVNGLVRIENIPYNLTEEMLSEFIGKGSGMLPEELGGGIHVIMDRTTGKTMDCLLEFISVGNAQRFITRQNENKGKRKTMIQNRHVTMELVPMSYLMNLLFPKAKGVEWLNDGPVAPIQPAPGNEHRIEIISREELVMVIGHARTPHRSPFSRKCLQRPYECLLSIVTKFPWYATDLYSVKQRDLVADSVLEMVEILRKNLLKQSPAKDVDTDTLTIQLMKRFQWVIAACRGFSDIQKHDMLDMSNIPELGCEVYGLRFPKPYYIGFPFKALGNRNHNDIHTAELFMPIFFGGQCAPRYEFVVPETSADGESHNLNEFGLAPVMPFCTRIVINPEDTMWFVSQRELEYVYNYLKGVLPSSQSEVEQN